MFKRFKSLGRAGISILGWDLNLAELGRMLVPEVFLENEAVFQKQFCLGPMMRAGIKYSKIKYRQTQSERIIFSNCFRFWAVSNVALVLGPP